jgi:hypothetical protein
MELYVLWRGEGLLLNNARIFHDVPAIDAAVLLHDGQFLTLMDRIEFP